MLGAIVIIIAIGALTKHGIHGKEVCTNNA